MAYSTSTTSRPLAARLIALALALQLSGLPSSTLLIVRGPSSVMVPASQPATQPSTRPATQPASDEVEVHQATPLENKIAAFQKELVDIDLGTTKLLRRTLHPELARYNGGGRPSNDEIESYFNESLSFQKSIEDFWAKFALENKGLRPYEIKAATQLLLSVLLHSVTDLRLKILEDEGTSLKTKGSEILRWANSRGFQLPKTILWQLPIIQQGAFDRLGDQYNIYLTSFGSAKDLSATLTLNPKFIEGLELGKVLARPMGMKDYLAIIQYLIVAQLAQNLEEVKIYKNKNSLQPLQIHENLAKTIRTLDFEDITQSSRVSRIHDETYVVELTKLYISKTKALGSFVDDDLIKGAASILATPKEGIAPAPGSLTVDDLAPKIQEELTSSEASNSVYLFAQYLSWQNWNFEKLREDTFKWIVALAVAKSKGLLVLGTLERLQESGFKMNESQRDRLQQLVYRKELAYQKKIDDKWLSDLVKLAQLSSDKAAYQDKIDELVKTLHQVSHKVAAEYYGQNINPLVLNRVFIVQNLAEKSALLKKYGFPEDTNLETDAILSQLGNTQSWFEARAKFYAYAQNFTKNSTAAERDLESAAQQAEKNIGAQSDTHSKTIARVRVVNLRTLCQMEKFWKFDKDLSHQFTLALSDILDAKSLKIYLEFQNYFLKDLFPLLSVKISARGSTMELQELINQVAPGNFIPPDARNELKSGVQSALDELETKIHQEVKEVSSLDFSNENNFHEGLKRLKPYLNATIMKQLVLSNFPQFKNLFEEISSELSQPSFDRALFESTLQPFSKNIGYAYLALMAISVLKAGMGRIGGPVQVFSSLAVAGNAYLSGYLSWMIFGSMGASLYYQSQDWLAAKEDLSNVGKASLTRAAGSGFVSLMDYEGARVQYTTKRNWLIINMLMSGGMGAWAGKKVLIDNVATKNIIAAFEEGMKSQEILGLEKGTFEVTRIESAYQKTLSQTGLASGDRAALDKARAFLIKAAQTGKVWRSDVLLEQNVRKMNPYELKIYEAFETLKSQGAKI